MKIHLVNDITRNFVYLKCPENVRCTFSVGDTRRAGYN